VPLFGEKSDDAAEAQAAQPVIDWINGLSAADLADELMQAFGPDGLNGGDWVYENDVIQWLCRGYAMPGHWDQNPASAPVWKPILEALQLLQHAELIVSDVPFTTTWGQRCAATRLGVATRANGKLAVRQRIKDRTGQ
jgi:hypothetical protein